MPPTISAVDRVIIVGGGFAGAWTARHLGARAEVTLISDLNYLLFTPMLAEVAAADIDPRHILTPLRQLCPDARLVVGTAVHVDGRRSSVTVRAVDGVETEYIGDALVLATGSATATYGVPGVDEHAIPFRTVGDALTIRHRLLGLLETATVRPDIDTTVAIVGAGASGAELAAALADFVRRAAHRYYSTIPLPRVILIDAADRVVPALPPRASRRALTALRKRGVEIRLGTSVREIAGGEILLTDGTKIPAGTIVWAAGVVGRPIAGDVGVTPARDGRFETDGQMRAAPGVWALGDIARVPDGHGGISPPTAQHALRQGKYLGKHLPTMLAGGEARPFRYRSLGELVSLGHRKAVGKVLGVTVGGFVAWFLWRSYYLLRLPGMMRRIRVAFDWTLDLVFPPDIADPATADTGPDLGIS